MFTNGVVASVKICRGDDSAIRASAAVPAFDPDTASRDGAGDGTGPDGTGDAGGVVAGGSASQEGSET